MYSLIVIETPALKLPLFDVKVQPRWKQIHRNWTQEQYFSHFKRSSTMINTSFQLPDLSRPNAARFVNTRTSDMEFSPSSALLAVASNCIKGGYISVLKPDELDKKEALLYSYYNSDLLKPTQEYFKVVAVAVVDF